MPIAVEHQYPVANVGLTAEHVIDRDHVPLIEARDEAAHRRQESLRRDRFVDTIRARPCRDIWTRARRDDDRIRLEQRDLVRGCLDPEADIDTEFANLSDQVAGCIGDLTMQWLPSGEIDQTTQLRLSFEEGDRMT